MTPDQMKGFCGGFTVCGWRQEDGTIRAVIDKNMVIPEWPKEIRMFDNTYVTEKKETFDNGYECVTYC